MKRPHVAVGRWWCVCAMLIVLLSAANSTAQDDLVELVVGLLNDPDKEVRALAFEQIRTDAPGDAATRTFAELLPKLPAETQAGLLSALADRGDKVAGPAVRELLTNSQDDAIRIAAIKALGRLGQNDDLDVLIENLAGGTAPERDAARRALVTLTGGEISTAMADKMDASPPPTRVALIEILTTRRARETTDAILVAALDDDPTVRRAAMNALMTIGEPAHIPGMVQGVLKAERGRERDAAEKAVMVVSHRIPEVDEQAAPLLAVMEELSPDDRTILLSTLGRVGGPAARREIEAAIEDSDLHGAGLEAICNWPNAAIAFRLLELARTDEHPDHRRTALRSLIRVAPLPDERDDQLRLDLMRTAMAMCNEDADRLLVLERAKAIRTVETLRFVLPYTDQSPYAEQACLTVVELAHHSGLREAHRAEFHAALDHVIAISNEAITVDRARRYKKGETWVRPK